MRKINPNKKCCEEYTRQTGNKIKEDVCASCYFNLFSHCWKEDQHDPVVTRALEGNDDSKQRLHDRLENSYKYAEKRSEP